MTERRDAPAHVIARVLQKNHLPALDYAMPARNREWFGKLERAYNQHLQRLTCDRYAPPPRPSSFVWTGAWPLNALGDVLGDFGVVAVNLGSLYILSEFFSALLSCPDLFRSVGVPSREVRRFETLAVSAEGIVVHSEGESEAHAFPRFVPNDPARRQYALLLTHLCLDFMFLHEAAHVLAGHPLYVRRELGARASLHARPVVGRSANRAALLHGVETDADTFAALLQVEQTSDGRACVVDPSELPTDPEERFAALACAITAYFLLVAPDAYGRKELTWTHPHPYLRVVRVDEAVRSPGLLPAPVVKAWYGGFIRGLKELVDAWQSIGMGSFGLAEYFDDMGQVQRELDALGEHHRQAQRLIQPYDLRRRLSQALSAPHPHPEDAK